MLESLAKRAAGVVDIYHWAGAVNDTLNSENISVAGETTDFEWFHAPGIPMPDGSRDENIEARRAKEAVYLVETLVFAARALGTRLSVRDAARRIGKYMSSASAAKQLQQMSE